MRAHGIGTLTRMPGYSGTPLAKKLGIKPGMRVAFLGAPEGYADALDLPEGVRVFKRVAKDMDLIQVFTTSRAELERRWDALAAAIWPAGVLWVSWPKRASKVPTDMTEDVVRDVALPRDFVDVKVCAVDDVWSGLKLVVRKEKRARSKP